MILKKKIGPKGSYAHTLGNIHVYYHNIQTSSPLKPEPLGSQGELIGWP